MKNALIGLAIAAQLSAVESNSVSTAFDQESYPALTTTSSFSFGILEILEDRRMGMDLIVDDLAKTTLPTNRSFEIVRFSVSPSIADAFTYSVFLDHSTGQYWIQRTGGIAGVNECYGPGSIQK